jgi:actin-related protein
MNDYPNGQGYAYNEVASIVIEIGSGMMKAGFAGDDGFFLFFNFYYYFFYFL